MLIDQEALQNYMLLLYSCGVVKQGDKTSKDISKSIYIKIVLDKMICFIYCRAVMLQPCHLVYNFIWISISTLDHCNIEQCYLKLKKNESESEANNSQLLLYNNATEQDKDKYEILDIIGMLELISKDCHIAELQCSVCNNLEDCKQQQGQDNNDNLGRLNRL